MIVTITKDESNVQIVSAKNPFFYGQYFSLRQALMKHFMYKWNRGEICWPRKDGKKKRPAWLKLVEERTITDTFDNFVVKESSLRAWNTNSNQWDLEIGKGLFTKYSFDWNEDIIQFNGEYIPKIRVDEIRN